MGEDFDKASRTAVEQAVVGLVVAGATIVGGVPGGVAAAGMSTFLVEWWRAICTGSERGMLALQLPAFEDQFRRVGERLDKIEERLAAQGNEREPLDTLRANAVFSEFAKGLSEAQTPEKRTALVNAAARQFDPDFGEPAVRGYWLARVRALSDLELRVLALVREHGKLTFNAKGIVPLNVDPTELIALPPENLLAFKSAAVALAVARDPLLFEGHDLYTLSGASGSFSGENFVLSVEGKVVVRFIADEE